MFHMLESSMSPDIKRALQRTKSSITMREQTESAQYVERAMTDTSLPFQTKMGLLHAAFLMNPFHGRAVYCYGMELSKLKEVEYVGFQLLERSFSSEMDSPMDPDTEEGQFACMLVGRYNHVLHKYNTSKAFLLKAYRSKANRNDVVALQLATFITSFPSSVRNAARQIAQFHQYMNTVLAKPSLILPPNPQYDLCILSAFNFELYYEANIRDCMHKYYLLSIKMMPSLVYEARVFSMDRKTIGIASAHFTPNNSVIADFRGVLQRLDRARFHIVFVNVLEKGHADTFPWPHERRINVTCGEEGWMDKARADIEALQLDLLLYLDSTMSTSIQQLLMSKLARVQAVSHGHPVTTGIPRSVVDYFVSWGAAELPTAQDHYTEELLLLPAEHMHQYYERRVLPDGRSAISNEPCFNYKRVYFESMYRVPPNKRWYTCMQKPFKLHPEMDEMILGILQRDYQGVVLLHAPDFEETRQIFEARLAEYIHRIYFIPMLPHHILMGLYQLSDVILDSYYAGGCTTTREALEIGAPVVTLPGKYLGGRWSYAYYQIMGYTELIASSKEEYIQLALQVNQTHRSRILEHVHKLFERTEAVASWTSAIETMLEKGL